MLKISAKFGNSKLNREQENQGHLMVSLTAEENGAARSPVAVALVLDISGSMSSHTESGQSKLEAVKDVAAKIIRNLSDKDEVTVVLFDTYIHTLIARQQVNKDSMVAQISNIHAGGSTNMCGGLTEGFHQLVESGVEGVRRVMILTDGQSNYGGSKEDMFNFVKQRPTGKNAVSVSTFGFGMDADQEFLQSLAKLGGGNYYYIKGSKDINNVFANELGGLLSCAAQNIKVKVKPNLNNEVLEVLNDFTVTDENGVAVINAEDIYSGETKHLLLKMKITKPNGKVKDRAYSLAHVEVVYDDLKDGKRLTSEHNVKAEFVKPDEADTESLDVAEQVGLLNAAKAQIQAVTLAGAGDFQGAQHVLYCAGVSLGVLEAQGSKMAAGLRQDVALSFQNFSENVYTAEYGNQVNSTARSATRYRGGAGGQCVGALNSEMSNRTQRNMTIAFNNPDAEATALPEVKAVSTGRFQTVKPNEPTQTSKVVKPVRKSFSKSKTLGR